MKVTLIETGVANIASVRAALERLGADVAVTDDPLRVERSEAVVLPGVGAFGAGMAMLDATGIGVALRRRVNAGAPTLAVCLGLQLLCTNSEESPGTPGLGLLPVPVRRLTAAERLPHFGWNRVDTKATGANGDAQLTAGDAYFAHSYAILDADPLESSGWQVARCVEGEPFVAAVERGRILACQFHPELSGDYGARLLTRWLALTPAISGGSSW